MSTQEPISVNGDVDNLQNKAQQSPPKEKCCQINKTLISVKILLLTFYGALGCLLPFLTLHMQDIGLDHTDITKINTVLPITALIGPPIAGILADKSGRHKLITVICMLCAAASYFSLLYIPSIKHGRPGPPPVQIWCDQQGANLAVQPCWYDSNPCEEFNQRQIDMSSVFRVSNCRYFCNNGTSPFSLYSPAQDEAVTTPLPFTYEAPTLGENASPHRPPHICFVDASNADHCESFAKSSDHHDFNASILLGQARPLEEDEVQSCHFKQRDVSTDSGFYQHVRCYPRGEGCKVVCDAEETRNGTKFLQSDDCSYNKKDHNLTFWLYFFLRAIADMFPAILISLLDAMIIALVRKHNGDFGRHKMFGLVAVGITSPIVGTLMDDETVRVYGMTTYAPVFYVYVILMVLSALITLVVPFTQVAQVDDVFQSIRALCKEKELVGLFFIMLALGSFCNYLETFLYIYLLDLGASKLLVGLTITMGIVPSIPFLFRSDKIIDYCGHHNLLILAFIMYGVRFTGFAFLTNPWWSMPLEALELFTLNLVQVVAATLTYNIVSNGRGVVATAQGVVWIAHFVIGRALGAAIGGVLIDSFGMKPVFCIFAAVALVIAILYCVLYYSLKYVNKKRRGRPHTKPAPRQPPVILNNNANCANGNYQPIPLQERT